MAYGTGSYGVGSYGADSSILYASVGESGSLTDSSSFTSAGFVTVLESASFADAASMLGSFAQTIAEGMSLAENQSMLGIGNVNQVEAGSLADTSGYLVVQNTSVAESVNMLDSIAAMTSYFLQASEGGTIIDHIDVGGVFTATLDDDAALADWLAAGQLYSKVQDELLALADSVDGEVTLAIVMVLGTARVSDGPASSTGVKLMNYYLLGSSVTLISAFSDINGLPVEPNEVNIEILQPDDTTLSVGNDLITNLGGGVYTFSFQPTMTGIHFYRFTGQGSNSVVAEAYFLVQQSFN